MNRRQRDKRKRRFYGILSDPWRKLISIGLAILLWYWLNAQITMPHEDGLELLYNDSSSSNHVEVILNAKDYGILRFVNANTDERLTKVTLKLEGPNSLMAGLDKTGQMAFKVTLSSSDIDLGNKNRPPSITFGMEVFHHKYDPEYDRRITQMTPRSVRIELRKNAPKSLQLRAKNIQIVIEGPDPTVAGRLAARLTAPTFVPNPVIIYGPQDQLTDIGTDTKLFKVSLDSRQLESGTEIMLGLELTQEFARRGLTVTPPTVIYKIDPRRVTYELKSVPVILDTTEVAAEERKKFVLDRKFVDFKIRVAAQSELDAALNDHRQASIPVSTVPAFWALEHARFVVHLKASDLTSKAVITRTPSIQLFTLDTHDKRTTFQLGRDYLPDGEYPIITIEKAKE